MNLSSKIDSILENEKFNNLVEFAQYIGNNSFSEDLTKKLLGRFFELKARERAIPLRVTFELTPFCNLNCKMCYVHLSNNEYDNRSLLPLDIWKSIASQAYKLGMRIVTLTGGECLTYPRFDDLYLYLFHMGIDIIVLSNGVLMDSKRIDFFRKFPPKCIQVSLYGSNENAYEKVTGKRQFSRIYHNLNCLRDAGLHIQIAITPNRFMIDDIEQLIKLVHSLQIPYEINCRLIKPRTNTGRSIEDMTLEQYIKIYRIRSALYNKYPVPVDPTELPMENQTGQSREGLLCGAGRSSCSINYEGNMMPCVSLYNYTASVTELGFCKAWERIHEYAIHYPLPIECNGCIYAPICIHCQAQHQCAPLGHCDRQICERTKKLAETGFYHYIGNASKRIKQIDE